jgi:Ser/Thr protein kinase RdoA (MazF antagonist)
LSSNTNANGSSTSSFPSIVGLLDFGDCHYSFRVADLANSILYFYLLLRQMEDPKLELLKRIAKWLVIGNELWQ